MYSLGIQNNSTCQLKKQIDLSLHILRALMTHTKDI